MKKYFYIQKFPKHLNLRLQAGPFDYHVAFLTAISDKDAEILVRKLNESQNSEQLTIDKQ
jgi:hypothetical protein